MNVKGEREREREREKQVERKRDCKQRGKGGMRDGGDFREIVFCSRTPFRIPFQNFVTPFASN